MMSSSPKGHSKITSSHSVGWGVPLSPEQSAQNGLALERKSIRLSSRSFHISHIRNWPSPGLHPRAACWFLVQQKSTLAKKNTHLVPATKNEITSLSACSHLNLSEELSLTFCPSFYLHLLLCNLSVASIVTRAGYDYLSLSPVVSRSLRSTSASSPANSQPYGGICDR
jgi:hypothetical protein